MDLSFVRDLVAPLYEGGGRPSVDPVVFFRLQSSPCSSSSVHCINTGELRFRVMLTEHCPRQVELTRS